MHKIISFARSKIFYLLGLGLALIVGGVLFGWLSDTLYLATMSTAAQVHRPKVVLDAGHGGMDGGAVCSGITEKDINLILAHKTKVLCRIFGFDVLMTREDDISIHDSDKKTIRAQKNSDLHNRLKLMTEEGICAAISIHLNKYQQSSIWGAQVFYSPNTSQSEELADIIQENIRTYIQPKNHRKTKKADSALFLLYNNKVNPAVLVECGFISNPREAELLKTGEYQDKLAMVTCYSLIKFNNREEDIRNGSDEGEK